MAQQQAGAGPELKPKARASSRVSSALKSGVVYGGSAVLTAVNNITPHIAGAVDILVIEQPDGSRKATPFYVRFGKYTALRTGERDVKLYVNDQLAPFGMHIGMYGQAYFAEAAQVSGADDEDDQEALLAGIMSPPSGYSSGADDSGQAATDAAEAGETLKAVRQRMDGIKEPPRTKGGAARRATAPGQVVPGGSASGHGFGASGRAAVLPLPALRADGRSESAEGKAAGTAAATGNPAARARACSLGEAPQVQPATTSTTATVVSTLTLQSLQLAPALSMADRNESFLSARETLFTPLGDEVVASAIAAAGLSSGPSRSVSSCPLGPAEVAAAAASEGTVINAAAVHAAGAPASGGTALQRAAPGCAFSSIRKSSSRPSLAGSSEGASPCGWSEDEVDGEMGEEQRQDRETSSMPSCGSPARSVGAVGVGLGPAGAGDRVGGSPSCPSGAEPPPLSSLPAQPLPPMSPSSQPPPLHPVTACGLQQPFHQQLGFPENRPIQAAAACSSAPDAAVSALCSGSGSGESASSGVGSGPAPVLGQLVDGHLGSEGLAGAQQAEARVEAATRRLPLQHPSDATPPLPDGAGGPAKPVAPGMMQPTVNWDQVLGLNGGGSCGDGTGTGTASPLPALRSAAAAADAVALPAGRSAALDAPRVSSHRGSLHAEGQLGVAAHGSGSHHTVSLLSSSLRAERGSNGGLAGAEALVGSSYGAGSSSVGWLRGKAGQRDSFESLSATLTPTHGSSAASLGPIACAAASVRTPAAAAAAGVPAAPAPFPAPPLHVQSPSLPAPFRHVAVSISVAASDGEGVRLRLCVLPEGPAAVPVDLGGAAVAAAAAHGVDAASRDGAGGAAVLPLLETASVASESGYLGDAELTRRAASARLPHPGISHPHNGPHHHHHTHGNGHDHAHAHYHGFLDASGCTHHDLHSTSAPLPSSGAVQVAAAAAAAAAAAGNGSGLPMGAATATGRGDGGFGTSGVATAPGPGARIGVAAASLELSLAGCRLTRQTPYREASSLFEAYRISEQSFLAQGPALLAHPDLVVRFHDGTIYPWQALSYGLVGLLAFGAWRLAPDMPCWGPTGAGQAPAPPGASAAAAAALLAAVAQGASAAAAAAAADGAREGSVSAAVAAAVLCTTSANSTPKKGGAAAGAGGGSWRLWMFGGRRENGRTFATGGGGGSVGAVTGMAATAAVAVGGLVIGGRSPPLSSPLAERQGSLEFGGSGGGAAVAGPAALAAAAVADAEVVAAAAAAAAAAGQPGTALPTSISGGSGRGRGQREDYQVVTKKSLTPTPEQLAQLPLKHGQNTIAYKVGGRELKAYIYFLPWRTKIVISDIDGTITKSDVLGHLLPFMGMDWSHPGIAELLTNIRHNNYLIMYLSSRSISQANITRDFINTLVQGEHRMPLGPVIISPHGLLPSLYREMILRRPHEFKIATLQDIRALFPPNWNPFYGGFGNRDTDEISYREVGVQPERIFIINPRGELRQAQDTPPPPPPAAKAARDAPAAAGAPAVAPTSAAPGAAAPASAIAAGASAANGKDAPAPAASAPAAAAVAVAPKDAQMSDDKSIGSVSLSSITSSSVTLAADGTAVLAPDAGGDAAGAAPSGAGATAAAASAAPAGVLPAAGISGRPLPARSGSGLLRGRSGSGQLSAPGSSGPAGSVTLSSLSAINHLVHTIFPRLKDGVPVSSSSGSSSESGGDVEEASAGPEADGNRRGSGSEPISGGGSSNNSRSEDGSAGSRPSSRGGDVGSVGEDDGEGAPAAGAQEAGAADEDGGAGRRFDASSAGGGTAGSISQQGAVKGVEEGPLPVLRAIDGPRSSGGADVGAAAAGAPEAKTCEPGKSYHEGSSPGAVLQNGAAAAPALAGEVWGVGPGCSTCQGAGTTLGCSGGGCECGGVLERADGVAGATEGALLRRTGVAEAAAAAVGGAVATAVPLPA